MVDVGGESVGKKMRELPPELTARTRDDDTGVVVVTDPAVCCSNVAPVEVFVYTTKVPLWMTVTVPPVARLKVSSRPPKVWTRKGKPGHAKPASNVKSMGATGPG
jgi:hypothetical protein